MKPENFVMADIFTHTNGLAVHVNHTALNENFDDGVTPFDAIDHAVANHDVLKETLRLKEEENKQIADENKQLRAAIESALRIKELWVPNNLSPENQGEGEALCSMARQFEQLIGK